MACAWVPAGDFLMGSTSSEADDDESPVTRVRISRGFWLGRHEVTQDQWQAVMGTNPSRFSGCGSCPVESVSWGGCAGVHPPTQRAGRREPVPLVDGGGVGARGAGGDERGPLCREPRLDRLGAARVLAVAPIQ